MTVMMVLATIGLAVLLGLWSYACGRMIDACGTWYRRRWIRRVLKKERPGRRGGAWLGVAQRGEAGQGRDDLTNGTLGS